MLTMKEKYLALVCGCKLRNTQHKHVNVWLNKKGEQSWSNTARMTPYSLDNPNWVISKTTMLYRALKFIL